MNPVRVLGILVCLVCFSTPLFAKHGTTPVSKQEEAIRPFTKPRAAIVHRFTPSPIVTPPLSLDSILGNRGRNYYGIEVGATASRIATDSIMFFFPYPYDDIGTGKQTEVGRFGDHDITIGFAIAGTVDLEMSEMISLQGKLGYRTLGSSGSRDSNFGCFAPATQTFATATFNEEYSLTIGMISLDVLGRFQFIKDGFYGLAGFGLGGIVYASASASQRISSPNLCQYAYESALTNLTGSFVSEEDDLSLHDDINNFRFDLRAGLGTFIPIDNYGMVLVPELTIGIPLTSFLAEETQANPDLLSIPYASITVGVKIPWDYFERVRDASPQEPIEEVTPEQKRQRKLEETGKVDLTGRIVDNNNQPVDDASITVVDLSTNEVVATDKTENGEYSVEVSAPGRYSVTADAPGYLFGSTYYELDEEGRILKSSGDIRLSRSSDGRVRLLVFFDFDRATLQASSYPELDRATALMKANPTMEVEIAGYTDAQGADAYNKDLSQRRANSVLDYLVRKGIEKARITATGYGEANPVADNNTETGRAENRRVEFVVRRR